MKLKPTFFKLGAAALIAVCAGLSSNLSFAVPAFPGIIEVEQPDGTVLPVIVKGDERGHKIFTTDGLQLQRDLKGFLTYAVADFDGNAVPSSVRSNAVGSRSASELQFIASLKAPENEIMVESRSLFRATRANGEETRFLCEGAAFPAAGSPRALVILVEFKDNEFSMDDPQDFYNRMLNEEGFEDYNATGSACDFFIENSQGKFTPQFDVYGPIKLAYPMRHYGANNFFGLDTAPEEIVIEACDALAEDVDFSNYDTNDDGEIDNVFIFYAGYGEADSMLDSTIWPHSADIKTFGITDNEGKPVQWFYNGKELNRYGMTCEISFKYRRPDGIGTFVHEFTHVMGLPDLYPTSYNNSFSPGPFSTMDLGSYNNDGRTPPHFSSFERYCLDWIEPEELRFTDDYELEALHESNKAYLIRTENENEFFLLENRQQECCDAYIPGHGMLVWHIDYVPAVWDRNVVNDTPGHQYVDLLEADNRRNDATREGDPFPGTSNVTKLNDMTRPELRSWNGEEVVVALYDIREEDGKIYFSVEGEASSVTEIDGSDGAIFVRGTVVENGTKAVAEVYDLAALKVCEIKSGSSVSLNPGLYIICSGDKRMKVRI